MIVFLWCVRAQAVLGRSLFLALIILILLATFTEQESLAMSATISADKTPREETLMLRKTSRLSRKVKRDKFQFELLEPRHLFSVSNGSVPALEHTGAIDDVPLGHYIESAQDAEPGFGTQGEHALDPLQDFYYRPIVTMPASASVNAYASLQLDADVFVNIDSGLTRQWSKLSGPGTATFGNAQQEKTTVQFDQAGTYVLQLAATNNGVVALSQLTVNVSAVNVVNIDQTWLNQRGDGPYYLDQQGKTYVLQTDVTTDGTAFAIIAKDVTFDLNGHTITYNNAAPITIPNGSFETGSGTSATGWNFANAPSASRYQGVWLNNETYDGDYSLKFSDTKTNQYITSTSTITLEPNTTYSLSAMFEYGGQGTAGNPGVKAYVRLIGTGGETTREVTWNQTNYRGIQLQEGVFKTGATAETYTVQVGIEGHASATKPFYIDDIKIQKTQNYGVAISPKAWNPSGTPDITSYGEGTNATIKNGTITQGQDKGTWSHGVLVYQTSGVTIEDMNVTVAGANCSALMGYDMKNRSIIINSNTLTSNAKTITSRDAFDGAVMHGLSGTITNNTITNGPHAGIFANGNFASDIAGNTIQLKVRYTNAFAILGGPSSQIYNNTINNGTGEFSSRGIAVPSGTAANPSKVYNNTIAVQNLANNQEYGGAPIGGTYGIQAEGGSYAEVYDNSVTVYGTTKGFALRLTSPSNNLSIHDNTFTAIANGTGGHAAPLSLVDTDGSTNVTFEDNTFITNDGIIGDISNAGEMELVRTTFEVDSAIGNPWHFQPGYSENPSVHSTLNFVDTTYADGTSRTFLENAPVEFHPNEESASAENRIIIALEWTTTLQIKDGSNQPLSGASVTIKDKDNNIVYTGTTNASGQVVATLKQQQMQGNTKTTYNGYTVTVTKSGYTFNPLTVTANKSQTLTIQSGAAQQQSLNQTGIQDPAQLALQAFLAQRAAARQATAAPQEAELTSAVAQPQTPEMSSSPITPALPDSTELAVDNTAPEEAIDEAYANLPDFLLRRVFAGKNL